jgi:hypothetical protein
VATGATEFVDSTTADVFIPELWSMLAIEAREQRLVFAKRVDRRYEDGAMKFGDTIHVPSRTHLTAQTKTKSSNAAIVFETQTETNTDITIATWEYVAMAVEDIVEVQANRDMFSFYAGEMGYALDLAIDDVLAGLPDDFTNAIGSLASPLSYVDLLRGRQYLDDANAPDDDRCIIVSPAEEANFMQMDQFINRDYTEALGASKGGGEDKGWIGNWLSMPVFKSTNVEGSNTAGHDNTMMHRHALALVVQMKPKTRSQPDIDYLVDKVAMEHLHGSREMRDDHGVFMRGL